MVSKNNLQVKERYSTKQVPHYGIRKLSVGVASVLLGTTFYMGMNGNAVHADTVNGQDSETPDSQVANSNSNVNSAADSSADAVSGNQQSAGSAAEAAAKSEVNTKPQVTEISTDSHAQSSAANADNRTILIDLQPKTPLQVISMHRIKIPDYGLIYIQGNAYDLCRSDDIQQVKLKWQHDNTYQLQIVHVGIKPDFDIKNQDSIGLDWNMTNNEFYHSSNDDSFYIPDKVVKRADQYECKINKLKSKRDKFHKNVKTLNKKISRYSAKRTQLLLETYRRMVPKVVGNHKVIVIERLGTKDMRQPGKSSGKNRGFNRKLALVKPYMLQVILANYAWKHAVRVIKVDSFKTSQVEFGTMHIHKHPLNQRSYLSDVHPGKVIKRDLNAAKNVLDWGLHPDHHIKVKLYPKVKPRMVADFM